MAVAFDGPSWGVMMAACYSIFGSKASHSRDAGDLSNATRQERKVARPS